MSDDASPDRALSAEEEMGRAWLGMGNLRAPIWLLGLEPGGTPRPGWPEFWRDVLGRPEVIDARADPDDPYTEQFFGPTPRPQPTWLALIRVVLAYRGVGALDNDVCLAYQREHFARADGAEALLELSGYAAPNLGVETPRERFLAERILRLRSLLDQHQPDVLLCYGVSRRARFEELLQTTFADDGFARRGRTTCALTLHPRPARGAPKPPTYWVELGAELRRRADAAR